MHPNSPPRTLALVGKYDSPAVCGSLVTLAQSLREQGAGVLIEEETARRSLPPLSVDFPTADYAQIGAQADVAVVVGGDGTMLSAARQLAPYRVPLVGVNQGRLGFMTDISRNDMLDSMTALLAGRFTPENRLMLDAEVLRDGRQVTTNIALNDIVVDKGAIGRMTELELFIDGEFIYTLRADGLIVCTPTGSTAYALSANGPILHPGMSGIGLVPLCPHALTNRPVVIGDQSALELRITHGDDVRVHFDGQVASDLHIGDVIRIRRSASAICFLHPPGYSYYSMLREKFHWSERPKGYSV